MKPRAIVVDTNVVVAGVLTRDPESPTARLLDGMIASRFVFLLSPELLAEYRAVLLRPRIRKRHGLDEQEVDALLTELVANAAVREPEAARGTAPEPGDQHLWDLVACEAGTVLVTGDRRLVQHAPKGAPALEPAQFVASIE